MGVPRCNSNQHVQLFWYYSIQKKKNLLFYYLFKDVPSIEVEYSQDEMYAPLVDLKQVTEMKTGTFVSICGYVRKVKTFY